MINNIFNKKRIDFFTLDEINNFKNGVLLLDSSFFHIIPMTLSKEFDEREREFEIEERLENVFEEYDNFYFLDKEIILQENNEIEKILIITIEKDKIYTLLDNLKEKKISLLGIYPLFLIELFNSDNIEKTYLEIEDERYRLYYFSENKLIDFQEMEFEKEELLSNPAYTYIEDNFKGKYFIYSNQKDLVEFFPNLQIREWRDYPLTLRDEFNFLPKDYLSEEKYKKNYKISLIILACTIIFSSTIFFLLQFFIGREQEKLNTLESTYSTFHEKNLQIREEILSLEEEIKTLREKNRVRSFSELKLSKLVEIIYKSGELDFKKIEYGDKTLTLQGIADSEEDIYNFQNNLMNYKIFKDFNHDFIKLNNNKYEFHIDIEVEYEISEKI